MLDQTQIDKLFDAIDQANCLNLVAAKRWLVDNKGLDRKSARKALADMPKFIPDANNPEIFGYKISDLSQI